MIRVGRIVASIEEARDVLRAGDEPGPGLAGRRRSGSSRTVTRSSDWSAPCWPSRTTIGRSCAAT